MNTRRQFLSAAFAPLAVNLKPAAVPQLIETLAGYNGNVVAGAGSVKSSAGT